MMKLLKKNSAKTSTFAEFINNASSAEKKKVYKDVLKKASDSQDAIVASAKLVASC
jgi:uncharacterized sodium:solute symporter family permease YidK